mmetsp:Transcript_12128/g.33598  ORF Transcript_12128/g.33598 Transcript_12128/m.33598 type:complete len:373 (-) Transcript_12128:320-1438(-)
MATQKALVQEHGISWKEANDHVLASKAELGEDATEEMIAAHAGDKATAAKAEGGIDASPTEDTQMSTDTSVETDPSAVVEPTPEEEEEAGEEEPAAEVEPLPEESEPLPEETTEPVVDETPKEAEPAPPVAVAAPVPVAAPAPRKSAPVRKAPPKVLRASLRIAFFDLASSDKSVVLDALNELIYINLTKPALKKKVKEVVAQGAAPMGVLQAMRNHGVQSPAVSEKCLSVLLALMAADETEVLSAMVELDATPLILELMHCHTGPKNVNMQVHGLGLLSNLSLMDESEAMKISENLGVDIVVKDMKEFLKVSTVQRRGSKVLFNLASIKPELKPEMREKEAVSTIGAAMESYPETGHVFKQASDAMKLFFR